MANTTSTTSFRADISQLKSAMQQAARQVKLANSEFKAATAGMDDWSQSAVGLKAKLTQLDKTLTAQKKQLELYEKELELTEKEFGKNSAAADRVKIAINNQKAAIAKTEKEMAEYNDELKDADKYGDNFTDTLEEMDAASESVSDGFSVMKGALANLVADGIRKTISAFKDLTKETISVGANFEASMSKVGAISGASADELAQLEKKAKELGEKTVFSATESADAFQYMAMAGWDVEDMLSGIDGILNLAAASGEDLATTSDIVTDALTAMGYKAGDAGRLADVMAAASSNANTNVGLMGQTFQYAAPLIGAMGYSMEDAAVAIGLMANAGIKGTKSGTALRSILSRLAAPTKEVELSMGELGVSLTKINEDGTESMKTFDEVIRDLREGFSDLTETQKTYFAKNIAGQEAMSALLAIVNASEEDFGKLTAAVRDSSGAAEEMAQTMNDNLAGQMTLLKSKIEGIQLQIYDKLKPALREAADTFSGALDKIDWDSVAKGLGSIAKKFAQFFEYVVNHFGDIMEVVKAVGKVLVATFVVSKIMTFASTIAQLVQTFKALKTATEAATTAQKLLNAAQSATVIGAITAAVAGLVSAFLLFSDSTDDVEQHLASLNEYEQKQVDEIYAMRDAYAEVKAARDEAVADVNAEFDNYKALSEELNDLVDANGKVKEGYEDRVNFILTTLNEAIGTEMKLVDGVIESYETEKEALDKLIETKKAEAILDANKDAYTEAVKNRNEALQNFIEVQNQYKAKQEDLNKLLAEQNRLDGLTIEQYAEEIGSTDNLTNAERFLWLEKQKLNKEIEATKIGLGELHMATDRAEESFVDYNSTIKNYEGLSSAIISGDAEKIQKALQDMTHDFISAETGTKQSLEKQVETYKKQYEEMKKAVENGSAVVTKEMVNDMKAMVDKSVEELDKFQEQAETSGKSGMQKYVDGMESMTGEATLQAQVIRYETAKTLGADVSEFEASGKASGQGFIDGILKMQPDAILGASSLAQSAIDSINATQESNSPSKITTASGEYFGQGYINGMENKRSAVWEMAYSLARRAINALKQGQKEGSPSKLTYQSGVYFVQGYINGIASQQRSLQNAVKSLVESAFKQLKKTEAFNFQTTGNTLTDNIINNLTSRFDYMMSKMTYQNEQKIKDFETTIDNLRTQQDKEVTAEQTALNKRISQLESSRDKLIDYYDNLINDSKTPQYMKNSYIQMRNYYKEYYDEVIPKEKKAGEKRIAALKKQFEAEIATQEKYRDAYKTASKAFLNDYQNAINGYINSAESLLDSTINSLADKYNEMYDKLLDKQNTLVEKMKKSGSLFNVSSAGIMTVNDLQAQTRQITDYTKKLQKIKTKVSAELFDEIASFDMKEGSAYIDRLLSMSAKDLKAYNKAYTEKIQAAEKAGDTIYKEDIEKVSKDYKDEIEKAFADIPQQLEDIGTQALKGFVDGLTKDTDYLDKNVKLFIQSMIDTFKSDLQIQSPSRIMAKIGEYTGDGFVEGLKETIGAVKKTAGNMIDAASSPLGDARASIGNIRGAVGSSTGIGAQTTNTINNYNLVQNNTSPKALSALETYQARRQQIALVKAFAP